MLAEQKRNTNIGVGFGLICQFIGYFLFDGGGNDLLGGILLLMGLALFLWGCASYARGKGYTGLLGILGLAHLPGLLFLVFLPDRHKDADKNDPASAEPASRDALADIDRLADLKERGAITDEEFQRKKQELLG